MWLGVGTGFSLQVFRGFRLRWPMSESFRGVRRRSRLDLRAMALRERLATRSTTLNCLEPRRRRGPTAAILFFVPVMPTIARPAEREPAQRWLVSMRMDTSLRAASGGRREYWERILMAACR